MKVFIQSNKYQLLAAKVSKYSFEKFGCEVKIMNLEDNIFLKGNNIFCIIFFLLEFWTTSIKPNV